ncbi:MAG: hypothetical protein AABP62_24605 [Planctomycetota bacterium]
MSRSNTGGARRPASKFPHLQKKMQKNSVLKNLATKGGQPKALKGKKQP